MMLHTLSAYWEKLISPQDASTPIEYLAAMILFALMVVFLDRALAVSATSKMVT